MYTYFWTNEHSKNTNMKIQFKLSEQVCSYQSEIIIHDPELIEDIAENLDWEPVLKLDIANI